MHNMALRLLQPTTLVQPTALLQPMPRLHAILDELTVDRLVPLNRLARISSTPLALVRRPMTFLGKYMPVKALARGSGMLVLARRNAALCASPMSISIAATASKRRARLRSADPTRARHFFSHPRWNADRPLSTERDQLRSRRGQAFPANGETERPRARGAFLCRPLGTPAYGGASTHKSPCPS
jgi:hypothetical protein